MQTFLPYPDFQASAKILDRLRLGKQRIEAVQILRVLVGESEGWKNHPAVRMWTGHPFHVWLYGTTMCQEWIDRGYKDTRYDIFEDIYFRFEKNWTRRPPWWLGNAKFHLSHQSNLVRKNPDYYEPLFPDVEPDLPYYWPVPEDPDEEGI